MSTMLSTAELHPSRVGRLIHDATELVANTKALPVVDELLVRLVTLRLWLGADPATERRLLDGLVQLEGARSATVTLSRATRTMVRVAASRGRFVPGTVRAAASGLLSVVSPLRVADELLLTLHLRDAPALSLVAAAELMELAAQVDDPDEVTAIVREHAGALDRARQVRAALRELARHDLVAYREVLERRPSVSALDELLTAAKVA